MKLSFYRIIIFLIVFFCQPSLHAQNNVLGGWYIVNLNYHLGEKFALYSEVQARSQHLFDDFYYHELKAGISYKLTSNQSVFAGFGNYETYIFPGDFKKPVTTNENRIWEQFAMSHNISRIKFEHRYRIEQRWVNGVYANRFRYRLAATIPINHATVINNTLFAFTFDELFFTDKPPYFLRNRVFGGLGFQFNKHITLQTGFIRQYDYRTSDNGSGKNFILTSLLINAGNDQRAAHHADAD